MNQIRSLLLARGHVVPQGRTKLATRLADLLDATEPLLSPRICMPIEDMRPRWQALDERIAAFDREFADLAAGDAQARRLIIIPGIGALNATALVAAIGDPRTFARGRDLAAWLGLVPNGASTPATLSGPGCADLHLGQRHRQKAGYVLCRLLGPST